MLSCKTSVSINIAHLPQTPSRDNIFLGPATAGILVNQNGSVCEHRSVNACDQTNEIGVYLKFGHVGEESC
jgi:hypothetical protein